MQEMTIMNTLQELNEMTRNTYDMVVNVSKTGVEGAVAMILEYIKNKEKGE